MGVLETRFGKDGEIRGGRTTIDLETITNILASMGLKEVGNSGYFTIDGQRVNTIIRISTNPNGKDNGSNGCVYFARTRSTGAPYLKVLTMAIEEIRKIREAKERIEAQLVESGPEIYQGVY